MYALTSLGRTIALFHSLRAGDVYLHRHMADHTIIERSSGRGHGVELHYDVDDRPFKVARATPKDLASGAPTKVVTGTWRPRHYQEQETRRAPGRRATASLRG